MGGKGGTSCVDFWFCRLLGDFMENNDNRSLKFWLLLLIFGGSVVRGGSDSKNRLSRLAFGGFFLNFLVVVARPLCVSKIVSFEILTNSCWFFLGWGFFFLAKLRPGGG